MMHLPSDRPVSVQTLILLEASGDQAGTAIEFRDYVVYQVLRQNKVLKNNDVIGQVKAVVQWVKDVMVYVKDPVGLELVTSPLVLLDRIKEHGVVYGDCDDHVVLLLAALTSIGVDAVPVGVKTDPNSRTYTHVIVSAFFDGHWVDIDPCAKHTVQREYGDRLIAG